MAKLAAGITPAQSKEARRSLALSQKDVIAATGLNAYKLKLFESRNFDIGMVAEKKLREFYEGQGVDFAEIDALIQSKQPTFVAHQRDVGGGVKTAYTFTPRMGFRISDELSESLVERLMDQMEVNDNRVGELVEEAFKPGFLGGISDETESKARELIAALAENHVIFRFLQGRNIVAPTRDEPKTLANYLAQLMQDSPVLPLLRGDAGTGVPTAKVGGKKSAPNNEAVPVDGEQFAPAVGVEP
jgi:hypothetical protein